MTSRLEKLRGILGQTTRAQGLVVEIRGGLAHVATPKGLRFVATSSPLVKVGRSVLIEDGQPAAAPLATPEIYYL